MKTNSALIFQFRSETTKMAAVILRQPFSDLEIISDY